MMIYSAIRNSIIISLLVISGCIGGGTPTPTVVYPIIQIPPRPVLHVITLEELTENRDSALERLIENDARLKNHIEKLEAAINTYNAWANSNR